MEEPIKNEFTVTKEDLWYLADVAWFLKGYAMGKGEDDRNDFGMGHYEVLTRVINGLKEKV